MNAINHPSSPVHARSVPVPLEEEGEGMEMGPVHIHHMLRMYRSTRDRIRQRVCGMKERKASLLSWQGGMVAQMSG